MKDIQLEPVIAAGGPSGAMSAPPPPEQAVVRTADSTKKARLDMAHARVSDDLNKFIMTSP
ncbi:MAG: hypothetical protein ACOYNZ_17970 [Rhodoferax sp.]